MLISQITYPVAKGMALLDAKQRKFAWDIIKSKPEDQKVLQLAARIPCSLLMLGRFCNAQQVDSVIELLEKVGAIDGAQKDAEKMVEEAWKALDKSIPNSFYKILLR